MTERRARSAWLAGAQVVDFERVRRLPRYFLSAPSTIVIRNQVSFPQLMSAGSPGVVALEKNRRPRNRHADSPPDGNANRQPRAGNGRGES